MGRLHYVEVKDFKSYKGYHKIGPFKRFTAIIGPNGAGKSNLMDAISFVLGERTQQLRVRSLKELVHGAPVGKPVANRASVSAVYLADDGTETRFTRIIIGSSSEYRINNKVVPGQEYTERLATLGVLIKAKNFLVFQGDVEAIAMKNPRELTQMFEEISRSVELKEEFEARKKEMASAHEDANNRFNRKKLLTKEKRETKEMKEEAEKYQKTLQELADREIQEKLFKLFHAEQDIQHAEGELKERQMEVSDLSRRRETCEDQLKLKRQEMARFSRETAVTEKKMREVEMEVSRLRTEYIKAKQKTAHVMKRLQASDTAHQRAVKRNEDQGETIAELERDYEEVKRASEQFEEDVQRKAGQAVELEDVQLREYYRLKGQVNVKAAKLSQELQGLQREQNREKDSVEGMALRKKEVAMREQELVARKVDIEAKIDNTEEEMRSHRQDLEEKRKQFESLQYEVQSASFKYHDLTNALEKLKDKLDLVSMDQRELERQRQNRELLENLKRLFPGVYGQLLNLCEPVHQRYSLALTRVLGHNMDSIVVDTEQTGRDCIQYLKDQRIEPHTFLPLDSIRVYPISEKLRGLGGSCKLLFDCVKYEQPEIRKAVQFACGETVVCDSMEEAQTVAYGRRNQRYKTVSLDGTLFRKTGEITGGMSELKKKAKRWDDKEVDKLMRQRDKCLEDLRKVTHTKMREAELRPLESDIKILEMRLGHAEKSRDYERNRSILVITQEQEGMQREREKIESAMESLASSMENRERKIKRLETKFSAVEDGIFGQFCAEVGLQDIRQYEEQNVHAHKERMKKKNELQGQLARLQNQLEYERSRDTLKGVRSLAATIKKDEEDLKKLQKEEADISKRIEAKERDFEEKKALNDGRRKEVEERDIEVKEVRKMLNDCMRDQAAIQKKVAILEGEIEQQRHERHQILKSCKIEGVDLPLLEGTLDSLEEGEESQTDSQEEGTSTLMEVDSISTQGARRHYAREVRIKIDFSDLSESLKRARGHDAIAKKADELHRECISLRASLEKYAGADLKASDRLKEVEDRLRTASDDMDSARKEFSKRKRAFDVVAKARRDRFQEAFDHVAEVVDDTYKKLSNNPGAIAQIHLEDSCEPFSGGINYHIIPPGKRYRTMEQLSGGERTIAALALLFSIHSYQPSPFFVLDEVDASLDNVNIAKLANYIKHHTVDSFQCIVISLKEEFYYHSDALVGVYGQPGGDLQVSGIATLDLNPFPVMRTPMKGFDDSSRASLDSSKFSTASRDTSTREQSTRDASTMEPRDEAEV